MRRPSTDRDTAPDPGRASPADARAPGSPIGSAVLGALLGGVIGGFLVVAVTLVLKAGMDFGAGQNLWYVVLMPVLGLAVATLVLHVYGRGAAGDEPAPNRWRTFHPDAARADISSDVVDSAGQE